MIFSELYSAYYNTVARILKAAAEHPLQKNELRSIIEKHAFGESMLNIEPALAGERWQLLNPDGTTPLKHAPTMPLTLLEKRWLKAVFCDPRIRLFTDEADCFPEIEPLFSPEDVLIFDKYADGDPYTDENYIRNFRLVTDAIRNRYALSVEALNRKGNRTHTVLIPAYLEYSEKDDKFRLIGSGGGAVNLGRVITIRPAEAPPAAGSAGRPRPRNRTVRFELLDSRNALERVLLHFAHFEKQAEKLGEGRYCVTVTYDRDDETEMVIRLLSFGPMVKVTEPQHFVKLMKERLMNQKKCGY